MPLKLKNRIKHLRMSDFVILILFICFIFFILFFCLFISIYGRNVAKSNLQYNRNISDTYTDKLDNSLSTLIKSASSLCNSNEMTDYIENFSGEGMKPSGRLLTSVNRFFTLNLDVYDLIISDGKNLRSFYMNASELASLPILKPDDASVKTCYVNNNPVLLVPVDIKKDTRKIGSCYLAVYQDMLKNVFRDEMRIGSTECFILSDTMQMLAGPADTNGVETSVLLPLVIEKNRGNEFTIPINGKDYFVNTSTLTLEGLYLYCITPCSIKLSVIFTESSHLLVLICITLPLLFLIVFLFLNSLNRSINTLLEFIADKKSGLQTAEPELFAYELNLIVEKTDDMIESIKSLQNENLKIQIMHRETRLKALQNQLNPHFLFNTFNCIIGMARVYHAAEIEKMGMCMAKITQYSLSQNLLTTVKEELEVIEDYITIQQTRFPERFSCTIDVDKELSDKKILRFSLQPIVENAIKHGLEPLESGGKLQISGRLSDGDAVFTVKDNGVGFEPEAFSALKSLLGSESRERLNSSGCGIGILNINNRIKLYYGNNYALDIESKKNSGTSVTLRMPLQQNKEML